MDELEFIMDGFQDDSDVVTDV